MVNGGWLKNKGEYVNIEGGSVAEWLKAHDSKSCGVARLSKVRILSLPPKMNVSMAFFLLLMFGFNLF